MNWFTGKRVISLFPRSTFVDRVSFVSQDTSRNNSDWLVKYRSRGFEVVEAGDVPSKESDELEAWERHVGDAYTWIMPFNVPGKSLQAFEHFGGTFIIGTRLPLPIASRTFSTYRQSGLRAAPNQIRGHSSWVWCSASWGVLAGLGSFHL